MRQPQGLFSDYDFSKERGAPDISTPVKSALVAFENKIRLENVEHGAAFDASGVLILHKVGEPDQVAFSVAEHDLMRSACFTHNHPKNLSFSVQDVKIAIQNEFQALRAVGPQFRHIMEMPVGGWPSVARLFQVMSVSFEKATHVVDEKVWIEGLAPQLREAEYLHQVWSLTATRLGILYRREYT